ncbi:MAG TPA: CBS domain-containing protein [Solirubrobacteraceae bacterium]
MATVADIMDPDPVTVTPETPADAVFHTLRDHELPGVPVVNEGGRVVGIVTENDLVIGDEQGDLHLPHYIELFGGIVFLESMKHFESRLKKATAATAKDLMTENPVTIAPDATVQEAAKVIATRKHNRLPVVEHGRLVGVVTRLDVLDHLAHDDE